MELGITVGEEDGADNTDADDLSTKPEGVAAVYEELLKVSDRLTVAAAFADVHGVYKPANAKLTPSILRDSQRYIEAQFGTSERPVDFAEPRPLGVTPCS